MQKTQFNDLVQGEQELLQRAAEAARHYVNKKGTHFVGAALETKDGSVVTGAAIVRRSASSSTCAERMAIDRALFEGKRDYTRLALVGFHIDGTIAEPIFPCGACRQIIFEYFPSEEKGNILVSNGDFSKVIRTDIAELLPFAYSSISGGANHFNNNHGA